MAATLIGLPVELLVSVASHLTTVEYGKLRLVCRGIERALFRFWAIEFFSTRQICMFLPSLNNLAEIAKHPELSHYVHKVIIGLDQLPPLLRADEGIAEELAELFIEHDNMLMMGYWKDFLLNTLQKLPAPLDIQIRDFTSNRLRPREQRPWRGYGIKTFQEKFQVFFESRFNLHAQSLVGEILQICSRAGLRLKSLESICRNETSMLCGLYIPPAQIDAYKIVLQPLTKFFITLSEGDLIRSYTKSLTCKTLEVILSCMPSLKHLRVNIPPENSKTGSPRARRASTYVLQSIRSAGTDIEILELGLATLVDSECKSTISALSKSLAKLTLHRIEMQPNSAWSDMIEQVEQCNHMKSLSINLGRAKSLVAWKRSAEDTVRYHAKSNTLWPTSQDVDLKGENGAKLAETARARIVFPASLVRLSSDADFLAGSQTSRRPPFRCSIVEPNSPADSQVEDSDDTDDDDEDEEEDDDDDEEDEEEEGDDEDEDEEV